MRFLAIKATAALLLTALTRCAEGAQDPRNFLLTFGDSYSKTGFNPTKQAPGPINPLGNPAYPGVTSSGGANWVGLMVTEFNTSIAYSNNNTQTVSYNFATSGATVDNGIVMGTANDFKTQVDIFTNYYRLGPRNKSWRVANANAVVGVWFGVNDIRLSYTNATVGAVYGKIADSYFAQVDRLYALGLRKFVMLSAPPMNILPIFTPLNSTQKRQLRTAVSTWNDLLGKKVRAFQASHNKAAVVFLNTSVPFMDGYNNPASAGVVSATCQSMDGKSCLWWDALHPATPMERLVAISVAKTVQTNVFRDAA